MRTTFINQNSENNIVEEGKKHLLSRSKTFKGFMEFGTDSEQDKLSKKAKRFFEDEGDFYNYGLSFDFVDAGTFDDQKEGYYRYQLSWGGPSEEIRFYQDGSIIFVYLDWFSGVGFDVSGEDWALWLKNFFEEIQSIDWASLEPEQIELYGEEENEEE